MTVTTALPQPTARCAAHPEPWLWFSSDPDERAYAAAICHRCPLELMCRAQGEHESAGIWGGEPARDPLGEGFELIEPPVAEHQPSRATYVAGCACEGCRAANTAYIRAHRAKSGCYKPGDAEVSRFEQLALGVA